jgi:SAM-dependent methyltransferase
MPLDLTAKTRRVLVAAARRLGEPDSTATRGTALAAEPATDEQLHPDPAIPPWAPLATDDAVQCNVCRWSGARFVGPDHSEAAVCPACGAIGRDRFLHWCLRSSVPLHSGLRIIETSPRLGAAYRDAMATWFFYRTSDFDGRAHRGNLRLDLQAIDLPDDCVDVMLSAHVLEHVPDTDAALRELRRIVAPGGSLVLQVPLLQGATAPPTEPEFHGDNTPVFWRFGFDLTQRLRDHGFDASLLCTRRWLDRVGGDVIDEPESPEFDVASMLRGVIPADLEVVADDPQADMLGFSPSYMYLTWIARVP